VTRLATRLIFVIAAWVALASCQPEPAPIAANNVIVYGQTVQGQLAGYESHWLFIGTGGDSIVVEFTTAGQMPLVAILDPGGNSVGRVAASTGRLERFRLPDSGQYAIAVGAGSGDYTLSLRLLNAADQTPTRLPTPSPVPITGNVIGLDESRAGSLQTDGAQDTWSFSGRAGAVVTFRLKAGSAEIDPLLEIFAPDGAPLASDDNSGGGRDALIAGIRLPSTGVYLIRVSGGGHAGGYVLSIQSGTPLPTPTATATPIPPPEGPTLAPTITPTVVEAVQSGAQIRVGQTVEGEIHDAQQVDRIAVFGAAGTLISVGMFPAEDSKLIPSFIMYAPNGEQAGLASGAPAAILSAYLLPSTGAYILYVRGYRGESTGAYTLTVREGLTLRDIGGGPIMPDVSVQGGLLRSGDREIWSIELPANATIAVDTAQSQFDPLVEIVGPDGKLLASAQPNNATHVTRIAGVTTMLQGRHEIRVSAARPGSTGPYAVTAHILMILPTATFSLVLDESIDAEVDEGQRYTYTFKGVPGEVVLIQARERAAGGFDPIIELYGPSGRRLALVDDNNPDSTDAILQISLDDGVGLYTVQVYGYAMTPGAFTLTVKSG
jgi:hypothetical protein